MTARVQMAAPDFRAQAMWNGEFKEIGLSDFKGRFVVLFFYPLDFTFVCPTEILAFSDRLAEFEKIGASVVGASVDSHFTHLAWWKTPRDDGGIAGTRYPLLADLTKKIATDYGVLLDGGVALRGLFVIDPKGIIRQIVINDLPIGRSVDETLRVIQAIKFADEHGEVCPADWKPGAETMKPDPKGSKEYFSKVNKQGTR
jgi:peroxiredoxin (alkyl hydroperoxide reductase subunit C)